MIASPRSLDESSLVHGRLGFGTPRWSCSLGYGVRIADSVLAGCDSVGSGDPDVVELDLDEVAGAPVGRFEPQVDRLAGEGVEPDRRRVPRAIDVGSIAGDPEDLGLRPVRTFDDRAERVGRARRRAVGEDVGEGQPLAECRGQGDPGRADAAAAVEVVGARRRACGRAGHERLAARAGRSQLLRAVARRGGGVRRGRSRHRPLPCRCRPGSPSSRGRPRGRRRRHRSAPSGRRLPGPPGGTRRAPSGRAPPPCCARSPTR